MADHPPDVIRSPRLRHCGELVHVLPASYDGPVPPFDPESWDLTLFPVPLVEAVTRFTWSEFQALPRVQVLADLHNVKGWSKRDNFWGGVATREIVRHVQLREDVRFVMVHAEYGYTANLALADFLAEDVQLALTLDGSPLTAEQGGPVRLVAPRLWSHKSPLWVRGLEFMTDDQPGFYEGDGRIE